MKQNKTLLLLLSCVVICHLPVAGYGQSKKPSLTPDAMWTYKEVAGKPLQLSVFLPADYQEAKSFPTMVIFHGGSWRTGEPSWHYPDCKYWSQRGMIAISVDYRLKERDQVQVPLACVQDAKSAIRFLRRNATKLKVDPDAIVVAGGSAGGQLAAALPTIDSAKSNDSQDDTSVSCCPNAVVLFNPFFKCQEELSPPAHVKSGLPPFITFLGDNDPAITVDSLKSFHESLLVADNDSEYYVGKGGKHGFCNGRNPRNRFFYWSLELTDRFLVRHGILSGVPQVKIPSGVKRLGRNDYLAFSKETTSKSNASTNPAAAQNSHASPTSAATSNQAPSNNDRPAKPNIVMILVDDLGWQDVGCYDIDEPCPFDTPNIDRLATKGIKFWQAYSPAPTCAPSRAAILSGRHPARTQKTHVVGGAPPAPYNKNSTMISPWYSGRMKMSEVTIAEALKTNGYTTGQTGKWHVAINHHAFPGPKDQGFDVATMDLGVNRRMMPDRLSEFATNQKDDPYRLDENGFPRHQNSENAITFLKEHHGNPFFLYYCTFLVHTPIHTRNKRLLTKYCKKMNLPFPNDPIGWEQPGQKNPYYASMVETLDYHIGRITGYLETTEDPRWPGHMLSENTYVIFTSDNGGMERVPGEIITDNAPLDKGKINAKEGGVRVPMIISGPGIASGAESNALVNGLDFYPTILNLTDTSKPVEQKLDGADLTRYLKSDLSNPNLILSNGKPRDTMVWHFPHSQMQSTIRKGDFKLVRNWAGYLRPNSKDKLGGLDLFQLYDGSTRVDLEEAKNLASSKPELARELNHLLEQQLGSMDASQPFYNPRCKANLFGKGKVCSIEKHGRDKNQAWVKFKSNGAKVVSASLIYTDNGGEKYEEWYTTEATIKDNTVTANLPYGTTHYVFNLVDENHFLISYPEMGTEKEKSNKNKYSELAIAVK